MPERLRTAVEGPPTDTGNISIEDLLTVDKNTLIERLGRSVKVQIDEIAPSPDLSHLLRGVQAGVRQLTFDVQLQDVGIVQHIGNGVARVSGLPQVSIDEIVLFPTGVSGLVLNLGREEVDVVLLGSDAGIQGGDLVMGTGKILQVPVGAQLLGRILNPLGEPLDDVGPVRAAAWRMLERDAPSIIVRAPITEPLQTGTKIVDALVPIGRGQRELILGDRQTGKTAVAVDAILNQKDSHVKCIYVSIGQKKSTTLSVIDTLQRTGALAHTLVVISGPDDPPALRYLAPYAGCTMAETLMEEGHDVLIVYDDLSKHADAYREISLLLRRPPGREAYPGDIFYLHARLLERAGKLDEEHGGASLTALPLVQTQRGNISAYIPTNLISITDGQIILDKSLFNLGVKPAVNPGLSVSRVGGAAQSKLMASLCGRLRLELAQYEEVARFARFGTEVDAATKQQIERGQRLQKILTQPPHQPLPVGAQLLSLLAAVEGLLDKLPVQDIGRFEAYLHQHFAEHHPVWMRELTEGDALAADVRDGIVAEIKSLSDRWLQS